MRVSETGFVAKAMKEHVRDTQFKGKSNYEAFRVVNPLVNDILAKATILVASRGNRALGFVAFEEVDRVALMHVYVRDGERREGVAKELLVAAFDQIDPESTFESYFPTDRWRDLAERYGFFVPESL